MHAARVERAEAGASPSVLSERASLSGQNRWFAPIRARRSEIRDESSSTSRSAPSRSRAETVAPVPWSSSMSQVRQWVLP